VCKTTNVTQYQEDSLLSYNDATNSSSTMMEQGSVTFEQSYDDTKSTTIEEQVDLLITQMRAIMNKQFELVSDGKTTGQELKDCSNSLTQQMSEFENRLKIVESTTNHINTRINRVQEQTTEAVNKIDSLKVETALKPAATKKKSNCM